MDALFWIALWIVLLAAVLAAATGELWARRRAGSGRLLTPRVSVALGCWLVLLALGIAREISHSRAQRVSSESARADVKGAADGTAKAAQQRVRQLENELADTKAELSKKTEATKSEIQGLEYAVGKYQGELSAVQKRVKQSVPALLRLFTSSPRTREREIYGFMALNGAADQWVEDSSTGHPLTVWGGDTLEVQIFDARLDRALPVDLKLRINGELYPARDGAVLQIAGGADRVSRTSVVNPRRLRDFGVKLVVRSPEHLRLREQIEGLFDVAGTELPLRLEETSSARLY